MFRAQEMRRHTRASRLKPHDLIRIRVDTQTWPAHSRGKVALLPPLFFGSVEATCAISTLLGILPATGADSLLTFGPYFFFGPST
jgi:hypothetical protein